MDRVRRTLRLFPLIALSGLALSQFDTFSSRELRAAQAPAAAPQAEIGTSILLPHGPVPTSQRRRGNVRPPAALTMEAGSSNAIGPNAGLTIIPTFAANIDNATKAVINTAIAFYQATYSDNITVNIEFHNMGSGLGQSTFFIYTKPYSTVRTALGADAKSADDATAMLNTTSGATNPINGNTNIAIKSANGRAIGLLDTPESAFGAGSPCPGFTGAACIGLNVALANSFGNLLAVVEHEVDEVLGLGSALNVTTTPSVPWVQDLFRWASPGVRSYAANASTSNPCGPTPPYFSINGGVTNLDDFNNCNNGGDYGDWITHTPSQVQDAFTNFSAAPFLTYPLPETRALDVIGYDVNVSTGPNISINDVIVSEGNSGTTNATFVVTLSASSAQTTSVAYQTADGTASGTANVAPNTAPITIPTVAGTGTPYPSSITVPAGIGNLTKVRVKINQFNHTYPPDVDILLVGPQGQTVVLMSDVGQGGTPATNVNLTFDDTGPALTSDPLFSGTYKPTNIDDMEGGDSYPSPAPVGSYGSALSVFNGTNPAGVWRLFVTDDFVEDGGSIGGGWSLELTPGPAQDYVPASGTLMFPPGTTSVNLNISIVGDTTVESAETFYVNLSNPVGGAITDSQGVGTILNDDGIGAPTITTHPASQAINPGQTASLSVVASGNPTLSYQWYQGTSGNTSTPVGTNSDSYTTPALFTTTSYWVLVTNGSGSADSNTATITVQKKARPQITSQ